jgi:hypothetical protein
MHTLEIEPLLYESDAAKILCVSPARLRRWRWEGDGPLYVRVGGPNGRAVRYRASDLKRWMADNTVAAASAND